MTRTCFVSIVVASFGLIACAHDVHAEVPKPPAGGHAFDVEIVETDAAGARSTHHFVLMLAGESQCAKLTASDSHDNVKVSTCLGEVSGMKSLSVEVSRRHGEHMTTIEGRTPLAGGRVLIGRSDQDAERVEVYVTSA